MILEDYGWDSWFDDQYKSLNMLLKAGRVVGNSEIYRVVCEDGVIDAKISDRLFYSTSSDSELPVPGDWVLIISDESESGYSIYDLLPRRSFLAVPDEDNPEEPIPAAANVDYILAAIPAGSSPDPEIVERLTEVSRDWGAEPLFIYYGNISGKDEKEIFRKAAGDAEIIFIDSISNTELAGLGKNLAPRKTYAVTGVNAGDVSAIISYLTDGEVFFNSGSDNTLISSDLNHGMLHVLPSSAILLGIPLSVDAGYLTGYDDNGDNNEMIEGDNFQDVIEIAIFCKFSDCRHTNEPGCAILDALDSGELDYDHYKAFLKALKKESGRMASAEQTEVKKAKKSVLFKGGGIAGE